MFWLEEGGEDCYVPGSNYFILKIGSPKTIVVGEQMSVETVSNNTPSILFVFFLLYTLNCSISDSDKLWFVLLSYFSFIGGVTKNFYPTHCSIVCSFVTFYKVFSSQVSLLANFFILAWTHETKVGIFDKLWWLKFSQWGQMAKWPPI